MSGVEALARVLQEYRVGQFGGEPSRGYVMLTEAILTDPGPLLAALAEEGIIHPQLCSRSGAACFNGWSGDE